MKTNKRTWILAIAACAALAAAGLTLAGCPTDAGGGGPGNNNNDGGGGDSGYTVKFKIVNASSTAITKIEFLDDNEYTNGSAAVRSTITEALAAGATKEYSVDGFIKEAGQINVAARVYYMDGSTEKSAENDYSFQYEEEKADPKKKFTFSGGSLSRADTY